MFAFIIPLRSSQASNSWERVCKLYERCVKSVCNQTSSDFKVLVVCHEQPDIDFDHPNIIYLKVDLPFPGEDHLKRNCDKIRKIITGLIEAKKYQPSHIMVVNADDCVSKHIVNFVSQNNSSSGWFINSGYEYHEGRKSIYLRKNHFHQFCGTSSIIRFDLFHLPPNLIPKNIKDDDLGLYYGHHKKMYQFVLKKGGTLAPLTFPGAVYIIGTGENQSQIGTEGTSKPNKYNRDGKILRSAKKLYKFLNSKPLSKSIRDEFALYEI